MFDWLTTCESELVLALKVPSPRKSAVIVFDPAGSEARPVLVAQALLAGQLPPVVSVTGPPIGVVPELPFQNCTVPVGGKTVVEEVTVAVNVTL